MAANTNTVQEPSIEQITFDGAPIQTTPVQNETSARQPVRGEQVHYVAEDEKHLFASIMAVLPGDEVELQVLDPSRPAGSFCASPVGHDEQQSIGTWHYPE